MVKVGIIFNDNHRNDTTGKYCLESFRQTPDVEVKHYQPGELITEKHDIHLVIDDGIPFDWSYLRGRPLLCYYAIDTHLGFEERLANAKKADRTFIAQKNDVAKFKENGVEVGWLPLGCYPGVHSLEEEFDKKYDVCFVGHTDPNFMDKRIAMLDALFKRFHNFYYGQKYFLEATKMYKQSKVVFNCAVKNDVNMRVFEATASGTPLVTDAIHDNGLEELYTEGEEICVYHNAEELLEIVGFLLKNPERAEEIAKAGQKKALERHTYFHRMNDLLLRLGR